MKYRLMALAVLLAATIAISAEIPVFGLVRQAYSGAVVSYIAGSGTNTAVEVLYEGDTPWRLTEVTSTAGTTTVYRVWNYERSVYQTDVATNFYGVVSTNRYMSGSQIVIYTNEVYSSIADTLPDNELFIQGDLMIVDFGPETNVVTRVAGSTP